MTTIAVWKALEFELNVGNPSILVVSDSRTTRPGKDGIVKLSNKCAKVVEIEARVSTKDGIVLKTFVVAVAGSTLIAYNIIFCLQESLRYLVGPSAPDVRDVANYACIVANDIGFDARENMGSSAACEVIIAGLDAQGSPAAMAIKPATGPSLDYEVRELTDFPYVTGSDRALLQEELERLSKSRPGRRQASIDQDPLRAFDRVFFGAKAARKTGGELQIFVVGSSQQHRLRPMRWNPEAHTYQYFIHGRDTWAEMVGNCAIGSIPCQLDDLDP